MISATIKVKGYINVDITDSEIKKLKNKYNTNDEEKIINNIVSEIDFGELEDIVWEREN